VQRQTGGNWITVATDADPDTRFTWARIGGDLAPTSHVTVTWKLRQAEPGTYRILHHGLAKHSLLGQFPTYVPFTGMSSSFTVL
jgi:neutral ceramidase